MRHEICRQHAANGSDLSESLKSLRISWRFSRCLSIVFFYYHQNILKQTNTYENWLVVWTPLKNMSQFGWFFPIGKIKVIFQSPSTRKLVEPSSSNLGEPKHGTSPDIHRPSHRLQLLQSTGKLHMIHRPRRSDFCGSPWSKMCFDIWFWRYFLIVFYSFICLYVGKTPTSSYLYISFSCLWL